MDEELRRVVEVWVPDVPPAPGGTAAGGSVSGTVGTGYLVAPRAVLTARHVVRAALGNGRDATSAVPRLSVRPLGERGAAPGPWLTARVAWESEELDVALIEVLDAATSPVGMAVFAEVTGDTHVTAVGFPITERRRDRVRDTDQAAGDVLYGAGWKRNRLVFDVRSSVARLPTATGPVSTWEGISGAGVLVGNQLVGIIVADHLPQQHLGRRLEVVPVTAILRAPGFREVAESLGVVVLLGRVGAQSRGRLEPASLPPGTVARPALNQAIAEALAADGAPIVALVGPPGFGKTTLALQTCHELSVANRYRGGALWLELGDKPHLAVILARAQADLTGHTASSTSDEDLAQRIGDELAARAAFLVIDDAWNNAALDLVLARTGHVPRLITTRNIALVEDWANTIIAVDDPMPPGEAIKIIASSLELNAAERAAAARIAGKLGGWPLLLALASANLRRLTRRGLPFVEAIARLEQHYASSGVLAFDPQEAVALSLTASLEQLREEDRRRYITSAIFSPAEGIPLHILASFWTLTVPAAEDLLLDLADRSLLRYDAKTQTVRLHSVIREYLQIQLPDRTELHRSLLGQWGDPLALTDDYQASHVAWHMTQAADFGALFKLVDDVDWYAAQLSRDPSGSAFVNDLRYAWEVASSSDTGAVEKTGHAPLLAREIRYALLTTSLYRRSGAIRSRLLLALVNAGLWTMPEAFASVTQNPYSGARGYGIRALAQYLPATLVSAAVEIARGLEDPANASQTLAALAPLVPAAEQMAMTNEALDLARRSGNAAALVSVAKIIPDQERDEVLREAREAAEAEEDPQSRFDKLLSIRQGMPDEHVSPATDALIQAARGIGDAADRARAFIALGKDPHMRSKTETSVLAASAWAAAEEIEDRPERQAIILEIADFSVEDRPGEILLAALDAMRSAEDPDTWADAVAAVASVAEYAPGIAKGALDEARVRAAALTNPAMKAIALAALARTQGHPYQGTLMAQAFDSIHEISNPVEQGNALLQLHIYVPDAYGKDVLQALRAAAQAIEPMPQRASFLRDIALLHPEPDQGELLRQAHEITPLVQGSVEPDETAFIRAATGLMPRLSRERLQVCVDETLTAAYAIADHHDRAIALAAVLPHMPGPEQRDVAAEALDAARQAENDLGQAEALTTVLPYLRGEERDLILARAAERARAISDRELFQAIFLRTEEDVVDVQLDWAPAGAHARARLLARLSALARPGQQDALAAEAVDAVYASAVQAQTLASVSPYLPATAVQGLLESIRAMQLDPIRTQVLAVVLTRLADLESGESARAQAAAIWGSSIPEPVIATLAEMPADTTPDDQPADGQEGRQDRPASAVDSSSDEPLTAAGDNESESSNTFTAQVEAYPGFPGLLFQLGQPGQPILRPSLTLPPALEGERADLERLVLENFVVSACSELPPSELHQILEDAALFMNGLQWTQAKASLISRLVDLGLSGTAMEQVKSIWPEKPPAQVAAAIWHLMEPHAQRRLAAAILTVVWQMKEPMARADALCALLDKIDSADHERAQRNIEAAIRDRISAAPSPETASEVTKLLGALPADPRLPLWQEALHAAARGTRRQLLTQLPSLIPVIEALGPRQLHEDIAGTLVELRHRWP
jgi:hypothetical protein